MTTPPFIQSALFAAAAGFLTRPCCVGPALLSVMGVGSASLGSVFMTHRPAFLALSATFLIISLSMTFFREGGWLNRWLAAVGSIMAFLVSAGVLGAIDVL